jgi:hypothetical protein
MGAISGTIDTAALSRLARGEGATRLATLIDPGTRVYLQLGRYRTVKLPVELCESEPPDEDDEDDYDCGYYVYASTPRVVALSHREVAPVRWEYLGVFDW